MVSSPLPTASTLFTSNKVDGAAHSQGSEGHYLILFAKRELKLCFQWCDWPCIIKLFWFGWRRILFSEIICHTLAIFSLLDTTMTRELMGFMWLYYWTITCQCPLHSCFVQSLCPLGTVWFLLCVWGVCGNNCQRFEQDSCECSLCVLLAKECGRRCGIYFSQRVVTWNVMPERTVLTLKSLSRRNKNPQQGNKK